MYDALVLDIDGVLTPPTSLERRRRVVEGTFLGFGVEPTSEEVDSALHGEPERLRRVCRFRGLDAAEFWQRRVADIAHDRRRALETGRSSVYADAGAVRVLETPLALATALPRTYAEHVAEACALTPAVIAGSTDRLDAADRTDSAVPLDSALDRLAAENPLFVGADAEAIATADAADIDSAVLVRHDRGPVAPEATYELGSLRAVPAVVTGGTPTASTPEADAAVARSERP